MCDDIINPGVYIYNIYIFIYYVFTYYLYIYIHITIHQQKLQRYHYNSFITPGILFRGTLIGTGCQPAKHSKKLGKITKSSKTFNKVGKHQKTLQKLQNNSSPFCGLPTPLHSAHYLFTSPQVVGTSHIFHSIPKYQQKKDTI